MKKLKYIILLFFPVLLLSSCSDDSYLNAIPKSSTALISMDIKAMPIPVAGLDLGSKVYLFENREGSLGLCAKVSDSDDLEDKLNSLATKGKCDKVTKHRGFRFTILNKSWVVGFSDDALLVMGPTVVTAQPEVRQQIARYLESDEDEGIKGTPIFDKLDSIDSPMAMVAQAQALPEQFVAPFTLGAPKDADASQVMIAAEMSCKDGKLRLHGETFSFIKRIDESIRKAHKIYRPIKGRYMTLMPDTAVTGLFMNVDGRQFLPLMQNNNGLMALLAGINRAIDMDNIIRSVNGDMNFILPAMGTDRTQLMMSAELANSNWLADVDYWKQSCPEGGRIGDWGHNAFYYTDSKTTYYFGVSKDMQYYSGSSAAMAAGSVKSSSRPISKELQQEIKGQKLVMIVNIGGVGKGKEALQAFTSLLEPLFGKLNSIVYTLK